MKLYFDAPPSLSDATRILCEDLGITPAPQDAAEGTVTVKEVPEEI